MYVGAYVRTYIRRYVRTYVRTYVHTYVRSYVRLKILMSLGSVLLKKTCISSNIVQKSFKTTAKIINFRWSSNKSCVIFENSIWRSFEWIRGLWMSKTSLNRPLHIFQYFGNVPWNLQILQIIFKITENHGFATCRPQESLSVSKRSHVAKPWFFAILNIIWRIWRFKGSFF